MTLEEAVIGTSTAAAAPPPPVADAAGLEANADSQRKPASTPAVLEGFEVLSETPVYQRYLQVEDRTIRYPDGHEARFDIVGHPRNAYCFVVVFAFDSAHQTVTVLREFAQAHHRRPQRPSCYRPAFDPTRYGGEGFGRNPDHDRLTLRPNQAPLLNDSPRTLRASPLTLCPTGTLTTSPPRRQSSQRKRTSQEAAGTHFSPTAIRASSI